MYLKNIEIGICKTCKHYFEEWEDPGARDCSLPSAQMCVDAGCRIEEKLPDNIDNIGTDSVHQCPLWEISLGWCKKHKHWFYCECIECSVEMDGEMKI